MTWRKDNKVDLYPAATKDNKLPLLYPVRGFDTIPDGNLTSDPGVSESVLRIYRWMGGSCLHKTDKDGCPIYIERLVSSWAHVEMMIGYKVVIMDMCALGLSCCKGIGQVYYHRRSIPVSYRM